MFRISIAMGWSLVWRFTQFRVVIPLALQSSARHCASAEPHAIALSVQQGVLLLVSEIRRMQQQIKLLPINQSPKLENSVGRLLCSMSIPHTKFAKRAAKKNIGMTKLNFLLTT